MNNDLRAVHVNLVGCARCNNGVGHPGLTFQPLTYPVEIGVGGGPGERDLTHWAPCPVNGEPILMRVKVETE